MGPLFQLVTCPVRSIVKPGGQKPMLIPLRMWIAVALVAGSGATFMGCTFHRTGHGFVVGSQWSLEYNRLAWLKFRSGNDAVTTLEPGQKTVVATERQTELHPWRSRLKGYRLGSRIFHDRGADSPPFDEQAIALTSKTPPEPPADVKASKADSLVSSEHGETPDSTVADRRVGQRRPDPAID